jgi:hypothetical protein
MLPLCYFLTFLAGESKPMVNTKQVFIFMILPSGTLMDPRTSITGIIFQQPPNHIPNKPKLPYRFPDIITAGERELPRNSINQIKISILE